MQNFINIAQGNEEGLFNRAFSCMKKSGATDNILRRFEQNYPNELESQLEYTKSYLLRNNFAF
jgi:hypothetical protein